MQVKEAIQQRRSIKHFDANHVITEKEIHELLSHAILSPTAFNIQNWRFVVVTDKQLRQKIRAVSWGQAQVEEASILIPEVQRDEAMRSCGMAAMNLMLTAKAMGYDTCPMDGFDFDKVGELLNLPKDHTPTMFVCVGKGIKEAMPRGGQLPLDQVVIQNQFK